MGLSVAHLVPDEMASTFVVTGTPDEVAKKIEPVWEYADSMCLLPPILTIEPEKSLAYHDHRTDVLYVKREMSRQS